MTLEEIKSLEHITVLENEYSIEITPEINYYCEVEDIPQNKIFCKPFDMLIQPEYNTIWVKSFIPIDASCIAIYGEHQPIVENSSL